MTEKDITSMRGTLDFLKGEGELLTATAEVDPIYEISGIQKALEDGPAILFENVKGYPGVRNAGNILSRKDRVAKLFDIADPRKIKFKCLKAIRHPTPPRIVPEAPCQEVVITEGLDVMARLPIIKYTERDAGRLMGSGNTLVTGRYFRGGSHVGFNRVNFRGKDWASIYAIRGTHLGDIALSDFRGQKIPVTYNIGAPPAVMVIAAGGGVHTVIPRGADEIGIAGGLQGSPVELVKARTVDAYAIAQSEFVIEGYLDASQRVWETEEAEKIGKMGVVPFFPEWTGYMGKAIRTVKFCATALTHRRDRPIFFTPLAHSFEGDAGNSFREACFLELADRVFSGLVTDVNILYAVKQNGGVVFQVAKKRRADEGQQKTILAAALASTPGLRLAVAVDEDVDIYSSDEVLWALTTRVNPNTGIMRGSGSGAQMILMPMERVEGAEAGFRFEGGIAFDATVPLGAKENFERAHYPVDRVDLKKWFSGDEIAAAKARQSEYARILAATGG
ncbi:MAG: UbiD family decarboxylase [Chloroflexi bacterium]|nr:UbiD family decarboxylase [Chloroflexota bacterium]